MAKRIGKKKAARLRFQPSLRFYLNVFFVLLGIGTFFYWGWQFFIVKEAQTPILYPKTAHVRIPNTQQAPPSLTPTVISHTFNKNKKNAPVKKSKEILLPETSFDTLKETSAEDLIELVLSSQFYQIGPNFQDLKGAKKHWDFLRKKHAFLQNYSVSFHKTQTQTIIVLECPYTESEDFVKQAQKSQIKAVLLETS